MKMNRSLHVLVTTLVLLLAAGCQSKGPTPKEATPSSDATAKVGSTETGGAHPSIGAPDPHAGMAPPPDPHGMDATLGQPDASGMIDVGAIAFKIPAGWEAQRLSSSMRRAQLSAPGSAGPGELIVYFFGAQGAGTAMANIDRWIAQFTNSDGSPVSDAKQTFSKVSGFEVRKVEVAGRYEGGMGPAGQPQAPKSDQRLIAAIVETQAGPYYLKFLGPDATVREHGARFDQLLTSIVPSP
jgi:hypothetical protein